MYGIQLGTYSNKKAKLNEWKKHPKEKKNSIYIETT